MTFHSHITLGEAICSLTLLTVYICLFNLPNSKGCFLFFKTSLFLLLLSQKVFQKSTRQIRAFQFSCKLSCETCTSVSQLVCFRVSVLMRDPAPLKIQ